VKRCGDGASPFSGVINVNGTLYGTTLGGGQGRGAGGTAFSLDPATGTETVLYTFCSKQYPCKDGARPAAAPIDVNGMLYGTTEEGGKTCLIPSGTCGTIFSIDPATGIETVLYKFCRQRRCSDGAVPAAGLIDMNGILYGTTFQGGNTGCNGEGCGTIFSIDPATGTETELYTFCTKKHCSDGELPEAGLISVNGTLYGTTAAGGPNHHGTVFEITP
ncbi:MAG TPA: choice-of-anchor tandem repeat GloVer-containing protein, partial [Rhizomicrobium sp.]